MQRKKKWKFRLGQDHSVNLKQYLGDIGDYIFVDYVGDKIEIVGFILDGWLTIIKGYEWDGCTPKFRLFGLLVGIPDFEGTRLPSMVHDFLIEYCIQHNINRKQIDIVFQKMMEDNKFVLRPLYASGVHLFRPIALKLGTCR